MALDFSAATGELETTLSSIETVLDLPAMRSEVGELEAQASAPDLWDDPTAAQKVTSRLSFVQGELRKVSALRQRLDDLPILVELAEGESDADSLAEAEKELG
ncbi:MAG TPA: PCRF domain-containing protein, partial [Motilibacterales bacterium]|nr:PCRF domain-containing protein [Motilibacterales bacterium]